MEFSSRYTGGRGDAKSRDFGVVHGPSDIYPRNRVLRDIQDRELTHLHEFLADATTEHSVGAFAGFHPGKCSLKVGHPDP